MINAITSLIFQAVRFELPQVEEATQAPYGDSFPEEKELVKAQLVVELMDRYHYPPQAIHVNYLVPLQQRSAYEDIDVFVVNKNKKPFLVFLVETPHAYKENQNTAVEQLYRVASVLNKEKTLAALCYYTRWYEEGILQRSELVVEYQKYPTKESWEKAGRPTLGSIPKCPA